MQRHDTESERDVSIHEETTDVGKSSRVDPKRLHAIGDTTDVRARQVSARPPGKRSTDEPGALDVEDEVTDVRRAMPLRASGYEAPDEPTDVRGLLRASWRTQPGDEEVTDVSTNPQAVAARTKGTTNDLESTQPDSIGDITTTDALSLSSASSASLPTPSPDQIPSFTDADPLLLAYAETATLGSDAAQPVPERPKDDLKGQLLLGRFRVKGRIGQGGMAAVYLAEHVTIGREVAIKVLAPHLAESSLYVDRFLQEARAASMIRHQNIVDITDFGYTRKGQRPFFVMEFLEGEDLSHTLKREHRLPWPRTRAIALQICSALEAAHDENVVHRDIKPENCFMMKRNGEDFVKLLDFGIAKVNRPNEVGALTSHGVVLGTVEYIPPERALNRPVDGRGDIYSLGVLIFRMVTGKTPYHGRNAIDIITAHCYEPPPLPQKVAPDVAIPDELQEAILKALAKQPDDRFQSVSEFAKALRAIPENIESRHRLPSVDEDAPTGTRSAPRPQEIQAALSAVPQSVGADRSDSVHISMDEDGDEELEPAERESDPGESDPTGGSRSDISVDDAVTVKSSYSDLSLDDAVTVKSSYSDLSLDDAATVKSRFRDVFRVVAAEEPSDADPTDADETLTDEHSLRSGSFMSSAIWAIGLLAVVAAGGFALWTLVLGR